MDSLLECSKCSKNYKTQRGLNKHMLQHTLDQQTASFTTNVNPIILEEETLQNSTDDLPVAFDYYQYEPESSYFDIIEEEEQEAALEEQLHKESQTKGRKRKRNTQAPLIKCNLCGKPYNIIEGYAKHRMTHNAEGVFAQAPDKETILKECPCLAEQVLKEIKDEHFSIEPGSHVARNVDILLENVTSDSWLCFVKSVCEGFCSCFYLGTRFIKPSQLREAFIRSSTSYITSATERSKLLEILSPLLSSETSVTNLTISFARRLSNKLLAFFIHSMIHKGSSSSESLNSTYAVTSQSTESVDFIQNMHYIAGSNVKSILRTGLRLKKPSDEWKRIISVLRNCFLITDFSEAPDSELMAWTEMIDRGKLIKVNAKALNFFVKLGATAKPLEKIDGSLFTEEVLEAVASSDVIFLWNDVINELLCPEESFKLASK